MNTPLTAALALAGLLAGWPLRGVVYRYAVPTGQPPRESCPDCHPNIGPPVLAVAVTTAILLGALAARVHPALVLAAACWLALAAVPLAFIDVAVRRLPDPLIVPAYVGPAVFLLLAAADGGHWPTLLRAVLGGLALAGFYLALLLISPSAMGLGDVKLAACLGTMLAWFGWRSLIIGGSAGFLLAGIYAVALIASSRATRKQQIPFGPFMIAAAFLVILLLPASPPKALANVIRLNPNAPHRHHLPA